MNKIPLELRMQFPWNKNKTFAFIAKNNNTGPIMQKCYCYKCEKESVCYEEGIKKLCNVCRSDHLLLYYDEQTEIRKGEK